MKSAALLPALFVAALSVSACSGDVFWATEAPQTTVVVVGVHEAPPTQEMTSTQEASPTAVEKLANPGGHAARS